jgi:prophage antirepressor-like protein
MAEAQLQALFLKSKIRVRGSAHAPKFCAPDVAAKIKDRNFRRITGGYGAKYCLMCDAPDALGRVQPTKFFTERGLYKYMLQSLRPEAEAFQEMVYDLLAAERLKAVSSAQLEAKIALDDAKAARNEAKAAKKEAEKRNVVANECERKIQRLYDQMRLAPGGFAEKFAARPKDTTAASLATYAVERFMQANPRLGEPVFDVVARAVRRLPAKLSDAIQYNFDAKRFEAAVLDVAAYAHAHSAALFAPATPGDPAEAEYAAIRALRDDPMAGDARFFAAELREAEERTMPKSR